MPLQKEETVYKPGRTINEFEDERLKEGTNRTGEENINVLFGLISLNKKLKKATLSHAIKAEINNPTFKKERLEGVFDLWNTLNKNEVKYILIGNFASYFHGFSRFTPTIEIYIEDELENKINLGNALEELNISTLDKILGYQFNKGWVMLNLSNGYPLDIVRTVEGSENMSFDECYNLASIAMVEGITVPFLHFNHLLDSKKTVKRPKEQLELLALEELEKERGKKR